MSSPERSSGIANWQIQPRRHREVSKISERRGDASSIYAVVSTPDDIAPYHAPT